MARRALNQLSRDARYREKLAQLKQPVPRESDDRLRLMFTCCHLALSRAAQVALTLPGSLRWSHGTCRGSRSRRACSR